MNILIVFAHPEPKSFNGVLKNFAVETLTKLGHNVLVSDLYQMKFKATADRDDFLEVARADYFNYLYEQKVASQNNTFAPDIAAEQDKIRWADAIIFQYPMWWTDIPAILKGWFDRVFALGFAYGPDVYENGNLKGKKAMLSITSGTSLDDYGPTQRKGDLYERLFNVQHEKLYFAGMDVLEPLFAGGVTKDNIQEFLDAYETRLQQLDSLPSIAFHRPSA